MTLFEELSFYLDREVAADDIALEVLNLQERQAYHDWFNRCQQIASTEFHTDMLRETDEAIIDAVWDRVDELYPECGAALHKKETWAAKLREAGRG